MNINKLGYAGGGGGKCPPLPHRADAYDASHSDRNAGKAHVRVPAPEHDSKTFSAGWESGVTLERN